MINIMLLSLLFLTLTGLKACGVEGHGPLANHGISLMTNAFADSDDKENHDEHDSRERRNQENNRTEKNEKDEFWEEVHEAIALFYLLFSINSYHGGIGIKSCAPGKFNQSNDYWTQADDLIERRSNMEKFTKYVLWAISLLLALSLIQDAFADDDYYRKRHRYRGGSQKVDDNNDDNNGHLKPVTNQTFKETCGECHFAYQPELLPSASWLKIVSQLDDHFGEEIEADPDMIKTISEYLKTNAAENSSAKRSKKIMRSLGNQVPMRITEIPYIRRKHNELDPALFKRESIGSLANCTACHITAEIGIYDDDDVKIPK